MQWPGVAMCVCGGGVVSFPDSHTQQRMDYITAMRKDCYAYQAVNEIGGGGGGAGGWGAYRRGLGAP